jgi:hypothetical protein
MAPGVAMMEAGSGEAQDWIRKGGELFWASGVHQAYGEFCRENPITCHMLTAPAQIQPELQVLVQQLNESGADQPGGSSAYQTMQEITAEIAEEWDRKTTPEPDEHPLDGVAYSGSNRLSASDFDITESLSREGPRGHFP